MEYYVQVGRVCIIVLLLFRTPACSDRTCIISVIFVFFLIVIIVIIIVVTLAEFFTVHLEDRATSSKIVF